MTELRALVLAAGLCCAARSSWAKEIDLPAKGTVGPVALARGPDGRLFAAWMETVRRERREDAARVYALERRELRVAELAGDRWAILPAARSWSTETSLLGDYDGNFPVTNHLEIAVGAGGEVTVAGVTDEMEGDKRRLFVQSFAKGKWRTLRPLFRDDPDLEQQLDSSGGHVQLVQAGKGGLVLALLMGNNVQVFRRVGGRWRELRDDGDAFSPGADEIALAIDTTGDPIILDNRGNGTLRVQRWAGGKWAALPEPHVTGRVMQVAMAIDHKHLILLAFSETFENEPGDPAPFVVHVLRQRDGGWDDLGTPIARSETASTFWPMAYAGQGEAPGVLLVRTDIDPSLNPKIPWETIRPAGATSIELHERPDAWRPWSAFPEAEWRSRPAVVVDGRDLFVATRPRSWPRDAANARRVTVRHLLLPR
jgi:hypothetical protein